MRFLLFSILIFLAAPAEAKFKPPKWPKKGMFYGNPVEGVCSDIVKPGKDPKPKPGDNVLFRYAQYEYGTFKPIPPSVSDKRNQDKKGRTLTKLDSPDNNLVKALLMLGKGGKGFFIFGKSVNPKGDASDSTCFYIELLEIFPGTAPEQITGDTLKKDSVTFVIPDPALKNFGDTLFTTAKLVDVPLQIISCGAIKSIEAFRFRMTWFDNGVQHRDILVYVECPQTFGSGFFSAGSSYVITAIPLSENLKQDKTVFNPYSSDHTLTESYYCLRMRKVG